MNSLVKLYRQYVPDDARSDDEITLEIAKRAPDKLANFPDAAEDVKRIQQQIADALNPSVMDYVKTPVGNLVKGFADTVASTPKAVAIGAKRLEDKVGDFDILTGGSRELEDLNTYKLGKKISDVGEAIAPETNEKLDKSFWLGTLPRGLGSAAGFLLGGEGAVVAGAGRKTAIGLLGAAAGGVEGYHDAVAKGATPDQAFNSFLLNGGVGVSEIVPLSKWLNRIDKVVPGKASLKRVILDAGKETVEEALQEAFQSGAGDVIAKNIVKYDPDRKLFGEMAKDAAAGGATGLLFSLLTHSVARHGGKVGEVGGQTPEVSKEPEAIAAVEAYGLKPNETAKLQAVANRELSGESGTDLQAALAEIYSNPDLHAAYTVEKNRLKPSLDLAQGVEREAKAGQAERDQAEADEAARRLREKHTEELLGQTLDHLHLENEQEDRARKIYKDLLTEQERELFVANLVYRGKSLFEQEAQARAKERASADEEAQRTAQTQSALQEATGAAIEEQAQGNLARDAQLQELRRRAAAASVAQSEWEGKQRSEVRSQKSEQTPVKPIWQQTLGEFLQTTGLDPATARMTWKSAVAAAVQEGNPVPEAIANFVLNDQTTVNAPQAETTGVAPSAVTPAVQAPVVDAQKDYITGQLKAQVDYWTKKRGDIAAQIEAGKVEAAAGKPQSKRRKNTMDALIRQYDFLGRKLNGIQQRLETGTGAFSQEDIDFESGDGYQEFAPSDKFTPELAEQLTRKSSPPAGFSKNNTHRLTAFQSGKSGQVLLLGTFKRKGSVWVANPHGETMELRELMAQGWQPFASVRTAYPMNNPAFTYANREAYHKDFGGAVERAKAGVATGAAVANAMVPEDGRRTTDDIGEDQEQEHDQDQEVENPGFSVIDAPADVQDAGAVAQGLAAKPLFTEDDAKNIYTLLTEFIAKAKNVYTAAVQVAEHQALFRGVYARLMARSMVDGSLPADGTPQQKAAFISEKLADIIDQTYEANSQQKDFVRAIVREGSHLGGVEADGQAGTAVDSAGVREADGVAADAGIEEGSGDSATDAAEAGGIATVTGPNLDSNVVFVVDEIDPKTKKFTTHTALIGFDSRPQALAGYIAAGKVGNHVGEVTALTKDDFIDWTSERSPGPLAYGKQFKASTRYREFQTRQRQAYRRDAFVGAIDGLTKAGVDVRVVKLRLKQMLVEFGSYQNRGDLITLGMADAHRPTVENFIYLAHEAGHAVAARLSDAQRESVFRAIDAVTDGPTTANGTEELLVERTAQQLAKQGFDATQSTGLAQTLWRLVKDILLRCAMTIQEAMHGAANAATAQAFVNNRVRSILSGDAAHSMLSFIGVHAAVEEADELIKFRDLDFVNDATVPSPDQDSTALMHRDVAAQGEVEDALRAMFTAWDSLGHNTAGLSYEQFVQSGNFVEVERLPAEVIAGLNQQLAAAGQPPVNVNTRIATLANASIGKRAAVMAHAALQKIYTAMNTRRSSAEWALSPKNRGNLIDRLARMKQRVLDLTLRYDNADLVLSETKAEIDVLFKEFRADWKESVKLGRKDGALAQTIRGIEDRMDRPLAKQYEVALDRLYTRLSSDTERRKFSDMLERIATLGIDWDNTPTGQIRDMLRLTASGDPLLAPLGHNTIESKALLGVVMAFGRTNANVMDFLELRRSQAVTELVTVNQALKLAMQEGQSTLQDARELIRTLPTLGKVADRLLTRLAKVKGEHQDLMDEIHRERTFIDFHHETAPLLRLKMANLESQLGALHEDWEPVNGAQYFVPPKPGATFQQVESNTRTLNLNANQTNPATLKDDLNKMNAWLSGVPADKRGTTWNAVNRQFEKLTMLESRFNQDAIKGSMLVRVIGSITDRLDYVGTPLARQASRRLRRAVSNIGSFTKPMEELGFKWGAAEGQAMQAIGGKLSVENFRKLFYDRALKYVEMRQDMLAAHRNVADAQDAVLRALKLYLEADPETGRYLARPGAWSALEKYYRATATASSEMDTVRSQMGLKIEDLHIFRESIGAPLFTVMRSISREAKRVYDLMVKDWSTKVIDKQAVTDAYAADPNALRQQMAGLFSPEVWRLFVKPIVSRPGKSAFYAPSPAAGVQLFAQQARVMNAFTAANGDAVAFAEWLYRLETGSSSVDPEFVGETLETFQAFFKQLHATQQDTSLALQNGVPVPPRQLMDSRKSEEFPAEWLEYYAHDPHAMKNTVKIMAYESAFGRNMAAMRNDLKAAKDELNRQILELEELQDQANAAVGAGASKRRLRAKLTELAEAKGGPGHLTKLEMAERNSRLMTEMDRQFTAILTAQSGVPIEMRWWVEALHTMTAMVVQGPGTALTDTVSLFEQPLRKYGFNTVSVGNVAGTLKSFAGQAFGTLYQAMGRQLHMETEYVKLLTELGYRDTDATMKLRDKLRAVLNQETTAQSPIARGVVAAGRTVRTILGTGFGRAKGDVQYPTFKPHAAFTQVAQWGHGASIISTWKTFESMVSKAVQHFESATGRADMADPGFRFTARELGYRDGFFGSADAFDFMVEAMQRFGMDLESVAREAVARRRVDPRAHLFSTEQYRHLAALSQNELTLESNLTNRPPGFITNPVLYAASPLVGWSVSKSNDVVKGFREANGEQSFKGFRKGLGAFMAIVPLALAFAWLRDEYDEEVQGKKANVMGYGEGNGLLVTLDRLGRVGSFGVLGDLANSALNQDTNREFSVDSRVFFVSSLISATKAVGTMVRQGDATYATVYRPLMAALGGTGYLQYAGIFNHAMALDNAEARVNARISVNNYLRAVGRELNMDVRGGRSMSSQPTPTKPWLGEMLLAAYANDATGFRDAYRRALDEAREEKKPDPEDYIARAFSGMHPLKLVFKTEPSEDEYMRLLRTLDDDGRTAVSSAVRLFNGYAEQIGGKGSVGKAKKSTAKAFSLDDVRRRAAAF